VTDSTCDLTHEYTASHDIEVVPMRVFFGEKEYLDGQELSPQQFYQLLESSDLHPTTRQPSPGDFVARYSKFLKEKYKVILSIHLSSDLTTSVQSAMAARTMIKGKELEKKK